MSSTRAGMGKTLFITRMAEKLDAGDKSHLIIPIHGPYVTVDSVMKYLLKHQDNCSCVIIHFDISPLVNNYIYAFYVLGIPSCSILGFVAGGHITVFTIGAEVPV